MSKTVHLIRHGESTFNAINEGTGIDPGLPDAPLSPRGRRQVAEARAALASLPLELAVTSPLTRAIESCLALFGGRGVPIVVQPLCRERMASSCDVGRPPADLARDFPQLDFSAVSPPWWYAGADGEREPGCLLRRRVASFHAWLRARPERAIAVVGHSGFFWHLAGRTLAHCEVHTLHL